MRKTPTLPADAMIAVGYGDMDGPSADSEDPLTPTPEPGAVARNSRALLRQLADYLRALADFGFEQWLTPRMAPVLYGLGVLGSLYLVTLYVIAGFSQSTTLGLARLLLIGPVLLLVMVTLIRVVLEICLVLFRIAVHLNQMAGHTEEMAGAMPRITFWRSWWRREPPKG